MSTGYFYSRAGELSRPPVPLYSQERSLSIPYLGPGMMRTSIGLLDIPHGTEIWLEDALESTDRSSKRLSSEVAIFPSIEAVPAHILGLPPPAWEEAAAIVPGEMDLVRLHENSKNQPCRFSEPTSVLEMHMAPSPGSSPSRSSVNGSPESSRSAKSVTSFSSSQHSYSSQRGLSGPQQQSLSSPQQDFSSPQQSFSTSPQQYPSLDGQGASFHGDTWDHSPNARSDLGSSSQWMSCMSESENPGEILGLHGLERELETPVKGLAQSASCSQMQDLDHVVNSGTSGPGPGPGSGPGSGPGPGPGPGVGQQLQIDSGQAGLGGIYNISYDNPMVMTQGGCDHDLRDPFQQLQLLHENDEAVADPLSQMLASDPNGMIKFDIDGNGFQHSSSSSNSNSTPPDSLGPHVPYMHGNNPQSSAFLDVSSRKDCQNSRRDGHHPVGQCRSGGSHGQELLHVLETSQPQCQEETGLYLVRLLLSCAEAVEKGDYNLGRILLSGLTGTASPFGDAMQRIAVYFGEALTKQIDEVVAITDTTYIHTTSASWQPKMTEAFGPTPLEFHVAYQEFYQALPYIKFAHFTANQAILEAVATGERIHVVDLNIGQGLQWPSFIQSLAVREPRAPVHLKITGVGPDLETLQQTGKRLCDFAASLHAQVTLEYRPVQEASLHNLDAGTLQVHLGESLAVNCVNVLNRLLPVMGSVSGHKQQGALEKVLNMVRRLKPGVVVLVEAEADNNMPSFFSRFVEALHHYSALFDCLEVRLCRSSKERLRIEKLYFASEIGNILAQEGLDAMVRHIPTGNWQTYFRQAGFRDLPFSDYAVYQAKLLLGLYNGAYKLTGKCSALNLGWQDTPIITVSAWTT